MSVKHQFVTAEAFWDMPDPPGKRLELVDGEMIEVSPTTMLHGAIVLMLGGIMNEFVRQHNLGIVAAGDVDHVLRRGPDIVRAPAVSFVARESVPKSGLPERGFWEGPPTLAVEVVSPDDRANEVHAKVQHYLEAGTRQVWVLWPSQRSVTVHDHDGGSRELGPEARLDGGDVLPGFTVRVGDLFEVSPHR